MVIIIYHSYHYLDPENLQHNWLLGCSERLRAIILHTFWGPDIMAITVIIATTRDFKGHVWDLYEGATGFLCDEFGPELM